VKAFARLYDELDSSTSRNVRVDALVRYFREAPPEDAVWALYFLSGRRLKRLVTGTQLRMWIAEASRIPQWLVEECRDAAGDQGETIALLHPASGPGTDESLSTVVAHRLLPLATMSHEEKKASVLETWEHLSPSQRYLWNKLISGTFRVGVARTLAIRALAEAAGIDPSTMAHRLMGDWEPTRETYLNLVAEKDVGDPQRPYPFLLAHPLEGEAEELGDVADWQLEWKWDGIRSQLLRSGPATLLWSRGEEAIADRFPDIVAAASRLPTGLVLDGEVLAWRKGAPMPFALLQRRIGKLKPSPRLRTEVPVAFLAYDCLQIDGSDIRHLPLVERRAILEAVVAQAPSEIAASTVLHPHDWQAARALRDEARQRGVEGLMLKRRSSVYGVGRTKGDWWKWKVAPLTIDAVLVAAQSGNGRRASLFTDYTFAVWSEGRLVPMAKAYSGLTDVELRTLDAWIRRNTLDKHGPVRVVKPEHVFELGFDVVQPSARHGAGVAVRFPRILRWRTDKSAAEADSLASLQAMVPPVPPPVGKAAVPGRLQLDLFDAEREL